MLEIKVLLKCCVFSMLWSKSPSPLHTQMTCLVISFGCYWQCHLTLLEVLLILNVSSSERWVYNSPRKMFSCYAITSRGTVTIQMWELFKHRRLFDHNVMWCVTDMGFLINNTTQMTFNRVYWAPRALESASWELALKPIIYNYNSITHS